MVENYKSFNDFNDVGGRGGFCPFAIASMA
jgi:hypothetical protein